MEQKKNELKIELTPEVADGHYSNLALISHSANEVYIDFIAVAPNGPQARVQTRVIMTPENAKNLLFALSDNIKNYENIFGVIERKMPIKPVGGNNQGGNSGDIPNPFIVGGKA